MKYESLDQIKQMEVITPTEAVSKADSFRDMSNNQHKDAEKIIAPDFGCVVYFFEFCGKICSRGFVGRAKKPAFTFSFQTKERRDQHALDFFNKHIVKKKKKPTVARELKVGDVLSCSWGYDQTNIDYYLVTKLVGKSSVELVEIGSLKEFTECMQGTSIPDKDNIIGKPFVKRANGKNVKISSFQYASLKEPKNIAGCEIYTHDNWTAYA